MCERCGQLAQYAKDLEAELMPELFHDEQIPEDPIVPLATPPISRWEVFHRVPEDLDSLRYQLEEAEADEKAAHERTWRIKVLIQDEELRRRWEARDRKRGYGRAWSPPAVRAEGDNPPSPVEPDTPSVPSVEPRPVESIAELVGKPRRRRAR